MNFSQEFEDKTDRKTSSRNEFFNKGMMTVFISDSRNLNETDIFSKTTRFNRSKSKNSMASPTRKSITYMNSTRNESKHNLFDANNITIKKTTMHHDMFLITERPAQSKKREFLKIKYADLLGKKFDQNKSLKNNKFIRLLTEEENNASSSSSNIFGNKITYDQIKTNTTKNKFVKELALFS